MPRLTRKARLRPLLLALFVLGCAPLYLLLHDPFTAQLVRSSMLHKPAPREGSAHPSRGDGRPLAGDAAPLRAAVPDDGSESGSKSRRGLECRGPFDVLQQRAQSGRARLGETLIVSIFGAMPELHAAASGNRIEYAARHGYHYLEISSPQVGAMPTLRASWELSGAPRSSTPPAAAALRRGGTWSWQSPLLRLPKDWDARGFGWAKVYALQAILEQLPWVGHVLWLDADVLLTNMQADLALLQAQDKSLVVGGDANGVNTGVFLLRNDEWSRAWLSRAALIFPNPRPVWYEQASLFLALFLDPLGDNLIESSRHWGATFVQEYKRARLQDEADAINARLPSPAKEHALVVPQCVIGSRLGSWLPGHFLVHFSGLSKDAKAPAMAKFGRNVTRDEVHVRRIVL